MEADTKGKRAMDTHGIIRLARQVAGGQYLTPDKLALLCPLLQPLRGTPDEDEAADILFTVAGDGRLANRLIAMGWQQPETTPMKRLLLEQAAAMPVRNLFYYQGMTGTDTDGPHEADEDGHVIWGCDTHELRADEDLVRVYLSPFCDAATATVLLRKIAKWIARDWDNQRTHMQGWARQTLPGWTEDGAF